MLFATIFEKVTQRTAEQLGIPQQDIQLTSSFVKDLGADSLDIVEIIMYLEEEYSIKLTDRQIQEIESVEELVILIQEELKK
jgi:acyl carrier protein